jgi:hypothetical protein
MIEFIVVVTLIVIAHRLRRAAQTPRRPSEVHIYHHFIPGPGEAAPIAEPGKPGNVVPFLKSRHA